MKVNKIVKNKEKFFVFEKKPWLAVKINLAASGRCVKRKFDIAFYQKDNYCRRKVR